MNFEYTMSKTETAEWNKDGDCETRPWFPPVYWDGETMKETAPQPFRHARTVILGRAQEAARSGGHAHVFILDCHGESRGRFKSDISINLQRKGA